MIKRGKELFSRRWVRATAYTVFTLVIFFEAWDLISKTKIFGQVPPPATTICAIVPNVCPSTPPGGGGTTPTYTITKTIQSINGDIGRTSGTVNVGDKVTYQIDVIKKN